MIGHMSIDNICGIFILSIVVSIFLSIANMDVYKGMDVWKGFVMWLMLTMMCFILGIGIFIGVVMVSS